MREKEREENQKPLDQHHRHEDPSLKYMTLINIKVDQIFLSIKWICLRL